MDPSGVDYSNEISVSRSKHSFLDYVRIARPDHWTKHVFMIPGMVFAYLITGEVSNHLLLGFLYGLPAACFAASANYVINEWLDAEFDKFHPVKKLRTSVVHELSGKIIWSEYLSLCILSIILAVQVGPLFLVGIILLLAQGVAYNIRPLRLKEKVFADVISESINNPTRLILGWGIINQGSLPPLSLLVAYWFGGAFLMSSKRLSEYRQLIAAGDKSLLSLYRASFAKYTDTSLLLSAFSYSLLCVFFLSAFLVRYRIEYILLFPLLAALFTYYLYLALDHTSVAKTPEKLHHDKKLLVLVGVIGMTFVVLSIFNFDGLVHFLNYRTGEFQFLKVK